MKSPFPGMDPYLEQYWGDVHSRLATYASDHLQRSLPPDLIACVEEYVAVESLGGDDDYQSYYPDVRVEELPNGAAMEIESSGAVAVADCIEIPRVEPMTQRSIRIVEPRSGNRIVTAIELLSPANKIGTEGRVAYFKKRTELLEGNASLVEIDLVREGRPNLIVPLRSIPVKYRQPYRICVVRAWRSHVVQLYRVSLKARLPIVSIPLRKKDKEVGLDLQLLIDMVYENGRYNRRGYDRDIIPPLAGADAAWAEQLLREKGLKK